MNISKTITLGAFCLTTLVTNGNVTYGSRTPELLDVTNPLFTKLQEVVADKEQLQADYEVLQVEYNNLQTKYENLVRKPVFDSGDVTITSNAHIYQIKYALEGTDLYTLANAFLEAEKTYGLNAFFLMGLVALESGWGTSDRALYQNNMSGYAVYNDNSVGKTFSSKEASVMETARLISEDYVTENSKYNTGKSIYSINQTYSADNEWASKIIVIAQNLLNQAEMWGVIEYE